MVRDIRGCKIGLELARFRNEMEKEIIMVRVIRGRKNGRHLSLDRCQPPLLCDFSHISTE